MSIQDETQRYVIPQGLDFPNQYLFWEMPELLMALSIFIVFLLLQELLLGIAIMLCSLFFFHKLKSNLRGTLQHYAWHCSLPFYFKGLEFAPPPAVTRFEE